MAGELPHMNTPSPGRPTLSAEINTATRKAHTELNRLIIARLPLALPPLSTNPKLLALGISAFADIYFAFEGSWERLISDTAEDDDRRREYAATHEPSSPLARYGSHDQDTQHLLCNLIPPGLWRSARLEQDLLYLKSLLGLDSLREPASPDQSLRLDIVRRVNRAASERPHVLVAYAWIMYMAIFSGGRWIRQQLVEAGPHFWYASNSGKLNHDAYPRAGLPGMSFLEFDGIKDGEDIKADFRERLGDLEEELTAAQRVEIVDEAGAIFEDCIALVAHLDERLDTASRMKQHGMLKTTGGRLAGLGSAVRGWTPLSKPSSILLLVCAVALLYYLRHYDLAF